MNLHAKEATLPQTSPYAAAPFLLTVGLLGTAIILGGPVGDWLGFTQSKQPLPLRRPLSQLRVGSLAPYEVIERVSLPAAMTEALGTEHYLKWTLRDTDVPPGQPLSHADLLITYYTGGTQLVPHTPDECYLGSGYEPAQAHRNRDLEVPTLGDREHQVPIRVCTFRRTSVFGGAKHTVVYTFFANDGFVSTRTGVRLRVQDPSDKFAYFSKVEVTFPGASRDQCIEGAGKLFSRLLPTLVNEHWPDPAADDPEPRQGPAN